MSLFLIINYPIDSQNTFKIDGYVCRAKSWSTKKARGVGRAKPTQMGAQEHSDFSREMYSRGF
ncbi:MAG: hypothetical protein AABY64_01970 [Bdellovibrionota bacterium]